MILYSHQKYKSLTSNNGNCQPLILSMLVSVCVVLFFISLMITVENLFIFLLSFHISCFVMFLFKYFAHTLFFVFLSLCCKNSWYILDIRPLMDICLANIFITLWLAALFSEWYILKSRNLNFKSNFSILYFYSWSFLCPKKSLPTPKSWRFSHFFLEILQFQL